MPSSLYNYFLVDDQLFYNYNIITMSIKFTWDENKNKSNIIKHNVNFDEAKSVFYDDNARTIHDPDSSNIEDRFLILGFSKYLNLLVVVHCFRDRDNEIRIISARKATKSERKQYQGYLS